MISVKAIELWNGERVESDDLHDLVMTEEGVCECGDSGGSLYEFSQIYLIVGPFEDSENKA